MAQAITKYQAQDGTLFDTEAQADAYDLEKRERRTVESYIDTITVYGSVDASELLQELTTGTLGYLVVKYRKATKRDRK